MRMRRNSILATLVVTSVLGLAAAPGGLAASPTTASVATTVSIARSSPSTGNGTNEKCDETSATSKRKLAWAPPDLVDPETIHLDNDPETDRGLELDDRLDYIVVLDEPITAASGISISGGHNVVMIGGEIIVPSQGDSHERRALYLLNQTGTLHIEGLKIGGGLLEGIDLDQRAGGIVQLQNIEMSTVEGSFEGDHGDVIQTWGGPRDLRLDRLVGRTTYQGLFLEPDNFEEVPTDVWNFKHIDLSGTPESGYLLWRGEGLKIRYTDVHLYKDDGATDKIGWPRTPKKILVCPPNHPILSGKPGMNYRSPGYLGRG